MITTIAIVIPISSTSNFEYPEWYSKRTRTYDYGCVYTCAYPVFLKDEIRLYYGGSDYLHSGWRNGSLCLATLRLDGFAGYKQKDNTTPAVIITSAIPYSGQNINITADVDINGSVKVSILNNNDDIIAEADPVLKNVSEGRLKFDKKPDSAKIRLRFELDDATLYSFRLLN